MQSLTRCVRFVSIAMHSHIGKKGLLLSTTVDDDDDDDDNDDAESASAS